MSNNPTIGGKIVLQGEKEYKKALAEINAALKVNYAQMDLAAAAAGEAADAQDTLRKKSEALSSTILTQKDKIALLSAQVQKAAEKYGEGSTKTMNYQAALLKAQTQLTKMESTQKDYRKALQESAHTTEEGAEKFQGMGTVLEDLAESFGVRLPAGMQSFVDKLDRTNVYAAAAVGLIAGIGGKLGALTLEGARAADELVTLSSQTGISTQRLQEFQYASEFVDVQMETLADTMKDLTVNMDNARNGNEDLQQAFRKLHVRYKESNGTLRDSYEVMLDVVDALHKMQPGAERNALAMQLMGENALKMNPLIEAGGEKLKELGIEAHKTGSVLDEETLQKFVALSDANQQLTQKMDAVKMTFGMALLPIMSQAAEFLSRVPTKVITLSIGLGGLALVIGTVTKAVMFTTTATKLMAAANVALGASGAVAGSGLSSMLPIILAVTVAVGALFVLVAGLRGKLNDVEKAGQSVNKITSNVNATMQPYVRGRNARGTPFWVGGRTLVGEEGPEVVELPRGSRIYSNGTPPPERGGSYTDNSQYIFRVDDMETFAKIENRMKRERQSKRMGYVGV